MVAIGISCGPPFLCHSIFISRHHRLAPTDVHSLFQYRYVRVSDLSPLFSVLGMDNVKHFIKNGGSRTQRTQLPDTLFA